MEMQHPDLRHIECTKVFLSLIRVGSLFQDQILPNLSSVFALLLADRNWLLEQHALEAFTQFAEVRLTCHSDPQNILTFPIFQNIQ